jgi:hypothetical protein
VVVDRPRAEEELRRDLPVRRALADEARDLELLRRELVSRAGIPLARRLAARAELAARAFLPRDGAEALEGLQRGAQVPSRLDATAAAELLAEEQLGAPAVERSIGVAVCLDRRFELAIGGLRRGPA